MKINNENIEKQHQVVLRTASYGEDIKLITRLFKKYPKNKDIDIVAMKIAIIDITNSTHLALHKDKISIIELAKCISNIKNIDNRIKNGDVTVVNEIAKCNGKINLFSFASKYCCYHNHNLYGEDDYSIYDNILATNLPKYFKSKITTNKINSWRKNFQYEEYNNYISENLKKLGINVKNPRRKFDHFVWFTERKNKSKKIIPHR